MIAQRCDEEISTSLLDAGQPVSYRTVCTASLASLADSQSALERFVENHKSDGSVKALALVVEKDATKQADPRARVIRIVPWTQDVTDDATKQIYGVYKTAKAQDEAVVDPVTISFWAQERSLRNDTFDAVAKQDPLSRELKAFFRSDIKCTEAKTRTDMDEDQGEEAVSIFDSIKKSAVTTKKAAANGSTAASSSSKSSGSFFKSSSNSSSSSKPAAKSSRSSSATPAAAASTSATTTKHLNADSMSNVLSIDSESDEDEDGAPAFVKKTPAASTGNAKQRTKRVISDDEDDEEDAAPPKKPSRASQSKVSDHSSTRNVKRKLSTSPETPQTAKPVSRSRAESCEDEPAREPAPIPTTRRVVTTKTVLNDQGYMVTEQVVEDVELTPAEIEEEKQKRLKKKLPAAKATAASPSAKKKSSKSGPVKQMDMRSFFGRK